MPAYRTAATINEASATTNTVSFTLTAGDVLLAAIGHLLGSSPTSVTWNGSENMTLVEAQIGAELRHESLYILAGGTAGTFNVVATFGSTTVSAMTVFSYSGVDVTNAFDGATKGAASDANPTLTITSPEGDLAVMAVVHSTAGTTMTMTNGTQQNYQESANYGIVICDRAGVGSTQVNGTITGETAWAAVGCNLNTPLSGAYYLNYYRRTVLGAA